MGIIEIIIIAIAESMDCFAVAVSTGLSKSGVRPSRALLLAFSFGFFQGGMTLAGYMLGNIADQWFDSVGSTIACTILCVLGARMIWKNIRKKDEAEISLKNLGLMNIALLSIATSIDAFAVGVSLAFIKVNMVLATSLISIASLCSGILGFGIGRHVAKHFKTKIPEIIAGIILIAIGIKTVI